MEIPKITKHKVSDTIKIGERTFRLSSYDPMAGNYILFQVLTTVLPFGIGSILNKEMGTEQIPVENTTAAKINKKDFMDLQKDILSYCFEILPGGETPVVRENGTYGIIDPTMKITIQLLIASLAFNFKDFFEGLPFNEEDTQDHQ